MTETDMAAIRDHFSFRWSGPHLGRAKALRAAISYSLHRPLGISASATSTAGAANRHMIPSGLFGCKNRAALFRPPHADRTVSDLMIALIGKDVFETEISDF